VQDNFGRWECVTISETPGNAEQACKGISGDDIDVVRRVPIDGGGELALSLGRCTERAGAGIGFEGGVDLDAVFKGGYGLLKIDRGGCVAMYGGRYLDGQREQCLDKIPQVKQCVRICLGCMDQDL
jgi:hypothetical protein